MLDILFLGTAASVPSRDRAPSCIAVRGGTDMILFDCGEGSQRQLMVSPFSFMKINGVFITHLHGDHFFGLPGLLQTMGLSGRKDPLKVCGPKGLSDAVTTMLNSCEGEIPYPLELMDLEPGDRVCFKDHFVTCFETVHNIPSLGYVLCENDRRGKFDKKRADELGLRPSDYSILESGKAVGDITPEMIIGPSRPGLKMVYSGDTVPCSGLKEAAGGADLLIHEATYCEPEKQLAAEHYHSTAAQAAGTAKECGCKHLILTHISNRYKDRGVSLEEARKIFPDTFVADDLALYGLTDRELRSV